MRGTEGRGVNVVERSAGEVARDRLCWGSENERRGRVLARIGGYGGGGGNGRDVERAVDEDGSRMNVMDPERVTGTEMAADEEERGSKGKGTEQRRKKEGDGEEDGEEGRDGDGGDKREEKERMERKPRRGGGGWGGERPGAWPPGAAGRSTGTVQEERLRLVPAPPVAFARRPASAPLQR